MKNNMKNRIIATLLSLLLVATAAVPVMTSLLKPVEVEAYGEVNRENYTIDASGPAWYWSAYLLTHNNYGSYKPNYGTHPFDSIRTGAYSYYDDSDALRMTMSGGDLNGTRGYLHLSDATSDSNMNLSTWKYVGLLVRHDSDTSMQIRGQVYGISAAGGQETQTLSASRNMQLIWFNAPSNGGNIDGLMLAFNGTIYIDSVIVATTTSIPTNLRWSEHGGYRITYNANGGTGAPGTQYGWKYASKSNNYSYGVTLSSTKPQRTGYTFQYWENTAGGSENPGQGIVFHIPSAPFQVQEHALTAVWEAHNYTVSYNGNGATGGSTGASSHTYDQEKSLTANGFTKTGYTFAGWATSSGGAVAYTNEQSVKNLTATDGGSVTLYAKWTPSTYTVSFDSQDGSSVSSQNATYNSAYGDLPTPTRAGYTFDGWYTAASGGSQVTSSTTVSTAGNHTLYAHWTAETNNTITYVSDSATVGTATYTTGTNPTTMAAPDKAGYTFTGWKVTSASGSNWTNGVTYDASTAVSGSGLYGNVTLTAQWEINTYTITYNANGGSVGSATVTYTTASPTALATPTKAGYTFAGWKPTTSAGGWKSETLYAADWQTSGVYSNITLVAQWTPTPYTVTLKEDENTTSTVNYNVEGIINLTVPTRTGYTFDGWKVTTADGGNWTLNDLYRDNLQIAAGKYGNVTLTAQWTENTYGITYDAVSGDMPNDALESYTYGETPTLPTPTRSGFEFLGWTVTATELDATGWTLNDTVTAVPSGATGAVKLTAQWKSKGIRLYYSIPDGTGTLTATEDYVDISTHKAASGVAVENMTAGYTLEGWYTDSTYETPVDPSWIDGNGKLVADFTDVADPQESYTFYAKVDYVKRHVTMSATCTDDDEQTFIYCITGKPVLDDVFGKQISLLVTVRAGETVNVEMPLGDYVVSEYVDWSWRYDDASGEETKAIEKEVATISRYDSLYDLLFSYTTPVNALWLNDYSVSTGTGKDPDTTA